MEPFVRIDTVAEWRERPASRCLLPERDRAFYEPLPPDWPGFPAGAWVEGVEQLAAGPYRVEISFPNEQGYLCHETYSPSEATGQTAVADFVAAVLARSTAARRQQAREAAFHDGSLGAE